MGKLEVDIFNEDSERLLNLTDLVDVARRASKNSDGTAKFKFSNHDKGEECFTKTRGPGLQGSDREVEGLSSNLLHSSLTSGVDV